MIDANVLVVDDESALRLVLRRHLQSSGCKVREAATGQEALAQYDENIDVVLLDPHLPDTNGLSLLATLRELDEEVPVIVMTGRSSFDDAVSAMKLGAFHYLPKPFERASVLSLVRAALQTTTLRRELRHYRSAQAEPYSFDSIIGTSPAIEQLKSLLQRIATSPASTVLFTGESGTGKDLAAKVLHFNSRRVAQRFMNITCSALPEPLLESQLFGHERGAFTDAKQQRKGLLELADGGTVFLDEIGEMPPHLQAKLLRFLEDKTFRRIGGEEDIRVDVRVVAATNRELRQLVEQARFRQDLYYRLNVLPVHLPPLRERSQDVSDLVNHYISQFNREFRANVGGVSEEARRLMRAYPWPGNVRELRNVVERAVLLCHHKEIIDAEDLPGLNGHGGSSVFTLPPHGVELEEVERQLVEQALARTSWNQTAAARLLGINRDQIRYRIKKFSLCRQSGNGAADLEPLRQGHAKM